MAQMGRPGLTLAQRKDLWRRWKDGKSLKRDRPGAREDAGSIHGGRRGERLDRARSPDPVGANVVVGRARRDLAWACP
jgi:hypothetical protein